MNLLQLNQIVDRALEERPELAEKEVTYTNVIGFSSIAALRLKEGTLQLVSQGVVEEEKVWLP
jgi:hypothetical protein